MSEKKELEGTILEFNVDMENDEQISFSIKWQWKDEIFKHDGVFFKDPEPSGYYKLGREVKEDDEWESDNAEYNIDEVFPVDGILERLNRIHLEADSSDYDEPHFIHLLKNRYGGVIEFVKHNKEEKEFEFKIQRWSEDELNPDFDIYLNQILVQLGIDHCDDWLCINDEIEEDEWDHIVVYY